MDQLRCSYPLPGVREATTRPQEAFIARATEVLASDARVEATYLVGGFAVGDGDPWSDVDLQCVCPDDACADLASTWQELVARITPVVYAQPFHLLAPGGQVTGVIGGNCITPEWLHFDIVFVPRSYFETRELEGVIPLFDRVGIVPDRPIPRAAPDTSKPIFPDAAVRYFLYMLGNMVSVIGRNEPIPGSNGVILVRDIALVALFLGERGMESTRGSGLPPSLFPFSKRLRRYLTNEQNALLESLPPVVATLDSVIAGYVALAEIFLPRAKALAAATGAEWPTDYERATVSYFERSVGVTITT
jgi:hypothetical protein